MIMNLLAADGVLQVRSHADLVAIHRAALASLAERGIVATASVHPAPVFVRVGHGRWLFDCPCGASVAVHPAWPDARCLGCGSIFPAVRFPLEAPAIEAALVVRPALATRNWQPGEPVETLRAENRAHGVGR